MNPAVSVEKKLALRQLRELYPPTFTRLAVVSGLHATTIRDLASQENWAKQHFPRGMAADGVTPLDELEEPPSEEESAAAAKEVAALPEEPGELAAYLLDEIRSLVPAARRGRLSKARVEALMSLVRVAERLDALDQSGPRERDLIRSDDELAELLNRVDERIVELAEDHAERLVAQRLDAAAGRERAG